MSATFIVDGKGSGKQCEVDDHGRLYTKANVISHMSHHATYHKNGYVGVFDTVLADTSEAVAMHFQSNAPGTEYEVYWLRVSTTANVEIKIYNGVTYTSGGNSVELMNTYFGNGNTSNTTAHEGGSSGDIAFSSTDATVFDGDLLGAYDHHDFTYEGGIVIPFSKHLTITATGSAGASIKITLGVAAHDEGIKL